MEKQYNLYNLEPSFKKYLLTENISPISLKNYLSDFRHFAGWVTFYLRSSVIPTGMEGSSLKDSSIPLSGTRNDINFITVNIISEYRTYLIKNNIPHKTINRRLSTIRKFCSFCISQGWMKENPAKKILNIRSLSSRTRFGISNNQMLKQVQHDIIVQNDILKQFQSDLEKEKVVQSVITSYLDDIRDFLKV